MSSDKITTSTPHIRVLPSLGNLDFLKFHDTRCGGKAQRLSHPAAPLAACVQRISFVDEKTEIRIICNSVDKIQQKLVVTATSLDGPTN